MASLPDVPDVSAEILVDLLAWIGPVPSWAGSAAGLGGEVALVAMLAAWLRLWALARQAPARWFAQVVAVPPAAVLAWGASEVVKQLWRVDRPCRLLPSFPEWAECPPAGDWSFPSNHAAIAGALTVGIVFAAWSTSTWWMCGLAVLAGPLAAVSRVVAGAHFPHDVVVGAVLGGMVAAMTAIVSGRFSPRHVEQLRSRGRLRRLLGTTAPQDGR
jgi:membrane-associated phospholipid phosphatase